MEVEGVAARAEAHVSSFLILRTHTLCLSFFSFHSNDHPKLPTWRFRIRPVLFVCPSTTSDGRPGEREKKGSPALRGALIESALWSTNGTGPTWTMDGPAWLGIGCDVMYCT